MYFYFLPLFPHILLLIPSKTRQNNWVNPWKKATKTPQRGKKRTAIALKWMTREPRWGETKERERKSVRKMKKPPGIFSPPNLKDFVFCAAAVRRIVGRGQSNAVVFGSIRLSANGYRKLAKREFCWGKLQEKADKKFSLPLLFDNNFPRDLNFKPSP